MPAAADGRAADPGAAIALGLREGAEWARAMLGRLGDAARAPGPDGGWSPVRIVAHLAAVDDEVWTPRLHQLAAHGHPVWPWTEPDLAGRPEPTPDEAAAAFMAARTRLLQTLAAMDEAAMRCTGIHAAFGELDAVGLVGEVLRHDAEHLASLAEAVAGSRREAR
jgi:hypothetical protein